MSVLRNPELFRTVLDNLQTGVCVADRSGKIQLWNHGAELITGHLQYELIGRPYTDYFQAPAKATAPVDPEGASAFTRSLHEGKPAQARVQLRHKEGHLLPVLLHTAPIRDPHGSIVAICGSFDVERFRAQDLRSRRHSVPHNCLDAVTGVATHGFTQFHLRENLAGLAEYQMPFGVICARAEGLEHFGATYGREASDAMLSVIAQDLSNCFRPADLVGRWAQDEFLAILPNCPAPALEKVFKRIRKTIPSAEIRWWGELLSLPLTLGCAAAEPADTIETLMQRAWRLLGQITGAKASIAAAGSSLGQTAGKS